MNTTDIINIIGTAAFAISGYLVGFRKRLDILGVVIVALLTAVGGGIVRDMLVNDVPIILRKDFYGSIAILIGAGLYLLDRLGWANAFTLNLLFGLGLATRLLVHRWGLGLPGFQNHGHGTDSNIPD